LDKPFEGITVEMRGDKAMPSIGVNDPSAGQPEARWYRGGIRPCF